MRLRSKRRSRRYTIFRFFNTYGPNQSEDFVLPRFVRSALRGEPITVYGDGSQSRTFCYVDDTVDTCVATHTKDAIVDDVINIGSDHEISILELARLIIRVTGSDSRIIHLPALLEGDMTRRCPDVSKMRGLLQRQTVSLEEGIRRLVRHYEQQSPAAPYTPVEGSVLAEAGA